MTSLTRNVSWTSVVNLVGPKGSSKEIIGECKYLFMFLRLY